MAIVIDIDSEPCAAQLPVHIVSMLHLIRLLVAVLVDEIDHPIDHPIHFIVGHITIAVLIPLGVVRVHVAVIVEDPDEHLLAARAVLLFPEDHHPGLGQDHGFADRKFFGFIPPVFGVNLENAALGHFGFDFPPGGGLGGGEEGGEEGEGEEEFFHY